MNNYKTAKTNVRTPENLLQLIKDKTDNFNGFAAEALSGFVRDLQFDRQPVDVTSYLVYKGSVPDPLARFVDGPRLLVTYRLKEIDLRYLQFNGYSVSRALILSLASSL